MSLLTFGIRDFELNTEVTQPFKILISSANLGTFGDVLPMGKSLDYLSYRNPLSSGRADSGGNEISASEKVSFSLIFSECFHQDGGHFFKCHFFFLKSSDTSLFQNCFIL